MSQLKSARDLEAGFTAVLNEYFYDMTTPIISPPGLRAERVEENERVRHNYQRDRLMATARLDIHYLNMRIAECHKYPRPTVTLNRRQPEKAPKGYLATKILERVLWYKFPGVRVK